MDESAVASPPTDARAAAETQPQLLPQRSPSPGGSGAMQAEPAAAEPAAAEPAATSPQASPPSLPSYGTEQATQVPQQSWALAGLSGRLEDICRDLRRSVEHEFALCERQLQAQHQADLEAQKLKAETIACQQQAKIEASEAQVTVLMKRVDVKQKQVNRSLCLTQRVRQNLICRLAVEKTFISWRRAVTETKDERLQDLLASKSRSSHMLGCLFSVWRHLTQSSWRERLIAHERAAADTIRAKLFEQMEDERAKFVAEAEKLRNQLAEEAKQRQLLQDNLKRVFMRGVCALNFEAMSLLSDPSGVGAAASGAPAPLAAAAALSSESLAAAAAASSEGPGPEEVRRGTGGGAGIGLTGGGGGTGACPSGGASPALNGRSAAPGPLPAAQPMSSFEQLLGRSSAAPSTAPCGSLFDRLDSNGDGVLSREEFVAGLVSDEARVPPRPVALGDEETQLPEGFTPGSASASACGTKTSASQKRDAARTGSSAQELSAPLPFVSYTGPAGPARQAQRQLPKSQRWQTAASPGSMRTSAANPRREVVTAGG
eukprot:TRINITY_DN10961_c0_g1_i1.p1 TRINITY_DN10961_c0_g1~~TRINITY_DN10961_c0_g1_i1.p1  ORF type:complete len:616 (+),score=131.40 TRINITY_DN10961_c0_g1_i1:214-1848(+)